MARDRQRSREARRRRRAAEQAGGDPSPTSARDIGLSDDTFDNLQGATPWADEARMAEVGPPTPTGEAVGADEADLPYERVPDASEDDLAREAAAGGGRGGGGGRGAGGEIALDGPGRNRGRVLTFLGACVLELQRVDWPDRRQVFQATAVVLGFVIIAGGWLGLMDAIWQPVMNAIL